MKVSLNWAQYYTQTDISSLPADELVKLATERLGGIEGYEEIGAQYDGVVVAKVVSCEKHPNADKLSVCKVDAGHNKLVQVVCGAPNVREGLLVAWIAPGQAVPSTRADKEPFVLEARELRGEVSNGMLASPHELGLNDDHNGILEIEEDVAPGTPFKELYGLDDVVIDIENKMFTHRPDCFGQLGVARELAGIQHKPFKSPDWYLNAPTETVKEDAKLTVDNQIPELCPRYTAIVLEDVQIKPSPIWLQTHLKRVGIRPINNVVDITNYIMMLTAQPLHAFDFDKVAQDGVAHIVVRRPRDGETMTLLDGKKIEPHKDAILICDQDKPIALGGVMGGGNSEVDVNTTRVVLESATFDMYNIRRTSMTHGIFTDAVTRFNKGQPSAQLLPVLHKAVAMFEELVGAHAGSQVVDSHPEVAKPAPVEVSVEFINARLGSEFTAEDISKLLTNVEFEVAVQGDSLTVTAPFWRTDIEIPEDIVEEVGRLYGFNRLPINLPSRSIKPVAPDAGLALREQLRGILSRAGANEVLTYSFVHGDLLRKVGQDPKHAFKVKNALSPDLQYYRLSLVPSLLDKVHPNVKAGFDEFTLFEIGKTHIVSVNDDEDLPKELERIALVYTADKSDEDAGAAYFHARRYLEKVLDDLGVTYSIEPVDFELTYLVDQVESVPYEPSRSAYVRIDNAIAGFVGELKPAVRQKLKLPAHTAAFEVNLKRLLTTDKATSRYTPLSRYPGIDQDISLKVPADVAYQRIHDELQKALEATKQEHMSIAVKPLDIYRGEDAQHKNVTFRVHVVSYSHTLQSELVNRMLDDAAATLAQSLNAARL